MIIFLATLGVIGVAASGPIMAATAAPALAIAFWRNGLGALIMGAPTALRNRHEFRALTREDYMWTGVAAIALALHFACFITALKLTTVAAATALVCLQSAWIAIFNLMGGQRSSSRTVAGLTLAFLGVVVISGFDLGLSRQEAVIGDILAIAGGALAGLYTMAGARARRSMSTGTYTTMCYGVCAIILLAMCFIFRQPLTGFPPIVWAGILAVTLVAQIMGHTVFNHLLAVLSPLVVSMIILLEIPGAALLAAVFLDEKLPAWTAVGLALILAGLAIVVLGQPRRRPLPPPDTVAAPLPEPET